MHNFVYLAQRRSHGFSSEHIFGGWRAPAPPLTAPVFVGIGLYTMRYGADTSNIAPQFTDSFMSFFATIYENIIFLHVSLTFGTVCLTVLWMSAL